jgi:hypothetical protein
MRIPRVIIGVVLMATLVIGCSKNPNQAPTVHFFGYDIKTNGEKWAKLEFKNPGQSTVVFQRQFEPGAAGHIIVYVEPKSSKSDFILVRETNTVAFNVKVMRVTSIYEISVPMPDITLKPPPPSP